VFMAISFFCNVWLAAILLKSTARKFLTMKFSTIFHRIGLAACIMLVISCFLPWTYYSDPHIGTEAQRTFTGFFTYQNQYGKPGKLLSLIAAIVFVFMLLPKIWAKRANLFIAALGVGYAIKSYILFTSCYNAYCPDKKAGLFIMMISMFALLITSAFPDIKLDSEKKGE
jgi:hypothetical protein